MASIFTYQEEPPRVHSPWSTPGQSTPQKGPAGTIQHAPDGSYFTSITKLEPERQDGPTEYKLHLLLRSRAKPLTLQNHLKANLVPPGRVSSSESIAEAQLTTSTPLNSASTQSRQARLQQLTTQLLWRLQQSSPFHSSSNARLVLPVLPEATPRLGVPDRPAKLLPGLEESQGALYEIGVADDGTLVGLTEDELEESLSNLRAMAASLGCVVDMLRRVSVASHGQESFSSEESKLWVAEVLVRPETASREPPLEAICSSTSLSKLADVGVENVLVQEAPVEQLRIAIVGASAAGKSSLVGTLTTSTLDNGRGKSRLSLLKHRHEIASGITSSVAQELIGYGADNANQSQVINYASGDVSSWPDIHNLSRRLVFISDSPGLPRFAKSTFRTLVSWNPHWSLFCVAADADDASANAPMTNNPPVPFDDTASGLMDSNDNSDMSLTHLGMCLKMDLCVAVVVTKMDIATKTGLKTMLSRVLSMLKSAGRTPLLLSAPSKTVESSDDVTDAIGQLARMTALEHKQVQQCLASIAGGSGASRSHVPIILTSSVSGAGFGKLHCLLNHLPEGVVASALTSDKMRNQVSDESLFHIDETFAIPPSRVYHGDKQNPSGDQGIVLCGHVARGSLSIGDRLRVGPFWLDHDASSGDSNNESPRDLTYATDSLRRVLPQTLSGEFSKSLQGEKIKVRDSQGEILSSFLDVIVVSLRSLRLPVRSMKSGETGTVGIQPIDPSSQISLGRARKGMILTSVAAADLAGYKSFTADFRASDFASFRSPPLILGGHAIIYINSVRAAVKVISLRLNEAVETEPSSPVEVFSFDGDSTTEQINAQETEIRITFKFVSSIEWLEEGVTVLVVPNMAAAGPISGPTPSTVIGLSGFVGRVSEVTA